MEKIAVVVVTYNRKKLLLENIQCLLKQSVIENMNIVIIDNASTDGTYENIQTYVKSGRITYINTGANLGGAGGFQYGIRYATEHNYDYVWVMDDDCMPKEDALANLLKADHKLGGNYGWLASKVLWRDYTICTMNIPRRTVFQKVDDFTSAIVPVKMASFVSLFIPVAVVKEIGLPIKEFFIWTDDWEYTRRISRRYPCYLCNDSVVIHKSKSNIGASIENDTLERLNRYKYLYRNDVFLYRREGIKGFLYGLIRLSYHSLRVVLKARGQKFERLKCIIDGTYQGLNFHPKIEYANRDKSLE